MNTEQSKFKNIFKSIILPIIISFVIYYIFNSLGFINVQVNGNSMFPTLNNNDRLIIYNISYTPKVGDIVVFKPNGDEKNLYIKRIVATQGQKLKVDIYENKIFIDGKEYVDNFSHDNINMYWDHNGEVTVPENSYFVLGDNRDNSLDSRSISVGFVNRESILGKAYLRVWPLNLFGFL